MGNTTLIDRVPLRSIPENKAVNKPSQEIDSHYKMPALDPAKDDSNLVKNEISKLRVELAEIAKLDKARGILQAKKENVPVQSRMDKYYKKLPLWIKKQFFLDDQIESRVKQPITEEVLIPQEA